MDTDKAPRRAMENIRVNPCSSVVDYFSFQITRRPAIEISPRAIAATHFG
jgi:hypothetical protein